MVAGAGERGNRLAMYSSLCLPTGAATLYYSTTTTILLLLLCNRRQYPSNRPHSPSTGHRLAPN